MPVDRGLPYESLKWIDPKVYRAYLSARAQPYPSSANRTCVRCAELWESEIDLEDMEAEEE